MTLEESIYRCETAEKRYKEMAEDCLSVNDYDNFAKYIALAEEERTRINYLKKYKLKNNAGEKQDD